MPRKPNTSAHELEPAASIAPKKSLLPRVATASTAASRGKARNAAVSPRIARRQTRVTATATRATTTAAVKKASRAGRNVPVATTTAVAGGRKTKASSSAPAPAITPAPDVPEPPPEITQKQQESFAPPNYQFRALSPNSTQMFFPAREVEEKPKKTNQK